MMVGAEVAAVRHRAPSADGAVRLRLDRLSLRRPRSFATPLRDVSLRSAAARSSASPASPATARANCSTRSPASGRRRVAGAIVIDQSGRHAGVNARRRLGAAFVPEERLGHAPCRVWPVGEHVLTRHATGRPRRGGFIDLAAAEQADERRRRPSTSARARADPEASALSGGNLQKFVVGREILREPGILVVSQPTWGVDAGAAATIRQALVDLARGGSAVLVISQDLDEIFEIADRIAVIQTAGCRRPRPSRR